MSESKDEKFKRVGQSRVNSVIKATRLLKKLSEGPSYEWTEAQIATMERVLHGEVADCIGAFRKADAENGGFDFGVMEQDKIAENVDARVLDTVEA